MKYIPILFSSPMVNAIVAGAKTQTRRVIKTQPPTKDFLNAGNAIAFNTEKTLNHTVYCPYGKVGDVLWVRETFYAFGWWVKNGKSKSGKQKWKFVDFTEIDAAGNYHYEDNKPAKIEKGRTERVMGWYKRSSLFMPKSACRIFLKITDIKVERLQEITEDDAIKEGVEKEDNSKYYKVYLRYPIRYKASVDTAKLSFFSLWQSINGDQSLHKNPWVWVISFKRIEKPENFIS